MKLSRLNSFAGAAIGFGVSILLIWLGVGVSGAGHGFTFLLGVGLGPVFLGPFLWMAIWSATCGPERPWKVSCLKFCLSVVIGRAIAFSVIGIFDFDRFVRNSEDYFPEGHIGTALFLIAILLPCYRLFKFLTERPAEET